MSAIHPNTMKQLLQLQFMQGFDLTGTDSASSSSGDGSSFADLLQSMLGEAPAATANKVIPASLLLRMTQSYSPLLAAASYTPVQTTSYEPIIQNAASKHGVDPLLVKAVIRQESSFEPRSVSTAGAKGLMQLMDDTAAGLGVTDSFDPEQNIGAGTRFLADLLRKYNGNEAMALAAYNAGPGRVDRLGVKNDAELFEKLEQLPRETQAYVKRVLEYKQQYALV